MSKSSGTILIVDDNQDILQAAHLLLKPYIATIVTEQNPNMIPVHMHQHKFDAILLDMNFARDVSSGQEGFDWLNRILELDQSSTVIMMTAFGDVNMAVQAIKMGATDFVLKPWQNEKLLATVNAAMKLSAKTTETQELRSRQRVLSDDLDQDFNQIIGGSSAMLSVFATIRKVAATDANVLILGENGTGKELVARALHRQSHRSHEAFITVDMGSLSETLFESELFGHKKGAFTDAREDRAGRFEIAHKGTLFLDEIGNLSAAMQAKLLSVIQNRKVTRIGSNFAIDIDIRLISATNLPIHDSTASSSFRQDLLYRINTVEIHLPPLRHRVDDIPLLAEHFLNIYARKYRRTKKLDNEALNHLMAYHWPGNIRELQHLVERAVIMSDHEVILADDFPISGHVQHHEPQTNDSAGNLDDIEREVIRNVLSKHGGNISHAAKELGLTRASLYRRLEKHGL